MYYSLENDFVHKRNVFLSESVIFNLNELMLPLTADVINLEVYKYLLKNKEKMIKNVEFVSNFKSGYINLFHLECSINNTMFLKKIKNNC